MIARVHPLSGEMIPNGKPANGKPRQEIIDLLASQQRRSKNTYDAARSGTDLDNHFAHADTLDADSANSKTVRHTLDKRSQYEFGSNGQYCGSIRTHVNMIVGKGPTLRMLTKNREFNQLVEREWYGWTKAIQLRRKLWCMAHARCLTGGGFAIQVTNPEVKHKVKLDLRLIEQVQCQTPFIPYMERGYIDGIKFDDNDNPLWYDILPSHPGSGQSSFLTQNPIQVPASQVCHWFKYERPGGHRGVPDMTATLTIGAMNRRMREATVAAVESAASIGILLKTQLTPGSEDADPLAPFKEFPLERRSGMSLPMGWEADQLAARHPNAQYEQFCRQQLSEQVSPIGQPFNVAAKDSSTYSFASGKLDTLGYYQAIDIEREDCSDLVLDPLFDAWFREWSIVEANRIFTPPHQWDYPVHPVIDAVADAQATDTKLKNGTITLRQVYSDQGLDLEDQLGVMAEDYFGEASDENILKMRQILLQTIYPPVAPQAPQQVAGDQIANLSYASLRKLKRQLDKLEESIA